MLSKLGAKLTYANVMSTLAMFVALAGGAYAAATIGAGDIKRDAVRSKHIKSQAVKSKQIKDGAVAGPEIRDGAVTSGRIADGAVTSGKIADGAVTTGSISDQTVTNTKIGDGAVTSGKISDDAVTSGKISDDAVTTGKISDDAVTSGKIADFSLRLKDLGGQTNAATATVGSAITVPNGGCSRATLTLSNPAPAGLLGSLVVGYLTSDQGSAVLNNVGFVVPTMISATSQGGAAANLMVCSFGTTQNIPVGSVFHYSLIGP